MTDAQDADLTTVNDDPLQPVYVIMGVTGSGKTTIGQLLSERLSLPFYDADDFHTKHNLQKLAHDQPLNDADREPWLDNLEEHIRDWSRQEGAVLACSALKHSYRSRFRSASKAVHFVFLTGAHDIIVQRLIDRARSGGHVVQDFDHILRGQYRDLEIPSSALQVDISQTPDKIVDQIVEKIHERGLGVKT